MISTLRRKRIHDAITQQIIILLRARRPFFAAAAATEQSDELLLYRRRRVYVCFVSVDGRVISIHHHHHYCDIKTSARVRYAYTRINILNANM